LSDQKLMSAVAAMAMQTMKLLVTHTSLGPTFRHIGSIRKELNPRTICTRDNEAPGQQLICDGVCGFWK